MFVAFCNGRYVQLPVNVGMREAWEQPWQPLKAHAAGAAGAASNPDRQGTLTYNVSFLSPQTQRAVIVTANGNTVPDEA